MTDRGVLRSFRAGEDGPHHYLARVDSNPRLDGWLAPPAELAGIAPHLVLHAQRCVECTLRMIFVRDRRPEQGENAVAGRLHNVAVIAMDGVDHYLEGRVNDATRLLG